MSVAELSTANGLRFEEILTLEEAAAYLRVPEIALRKMATEGGVPAQSIGNEWRFLKRALEDWLRSCGRRDGYPFSPAWLLDSPFAEELVLLIERRLLHQLEAAAPERGSKAAVMKHFGMWKDDRDMEEQLANLRAQREAQ
jgi:excisionase family DNA binding protein